MIWALLLFTCLGVWGLNLAQADVIFVSGDVSGTWSADTVIVTAEVRIPPGEMLVIEPGVEVFFQAYCRFIVDHAATLQAIGTATDSILFDSHWLWPQNGWQGVRFLSASENSSLEYCHLTHGYASGIDADQYGGAIYCNDSNPTIQNCLIDSCQAAEKGGGIYCHGSNPSISNNTLRGNQVYYGDGGGGGIACDSSAYPNIVGNTFIGNQAYWGGAIYCYYADPLISGNSLNENWADKGSGIHCRYSNPTISANTFDENWCGSSGTIYCYHSSPAVSNNTLNDNYACYGGGIYCHYSTPEVSGNILSGNDAYIRGGGIYCLYSDPTITSNTLTGNSAYDGGGIYCHDSNPSIELNEISSNIAENKGGGIYLDTSNPSLNKNTIVDNQAEQGGGIYISGSDPVLVNCIVWENQPNGLYPAYGSNVQVTYSDINLDPVWPGEGNINADPLFINAAQGDYHLLWDSPCIDSGDPNPIYNDPDGSRADMGCYPYDSTYVALQTTPSQIKPVKFCLLGCFPNPFNSVTTIRFDLPIASWVKLEVFDLAGRIVSGLETTPATTVVDGWREVGSHEVTFDGLNLPSGMYFIRLQARDYVDVQKMVLIK